MMVNKNNNETEQAINHLSKYDKRLLRIIKKIGKCNLKKHRNYFNSLLEAIIGQQLSMKAASAICQKFYTAFGESITPDEILKIDDERLRSVGLSNSKTKYIKDLASKIANKELFLTNFSKKNNEQIIAELTTVKGIGTWTAQMFLIFTLARPDVLPCGDLGIKKAIMKLYEFEELPSEEMVNEIALINNWSPYCSYASLYLWKSLNL